MCGWHKAGRVIGAFGWYYKNCKMCNGLQSTRWRWTGINVQVYLWPSSQNTMGQWKRRSEYLSQIILTWPGGLWWLQPCHLTQGYSRCGLRTTSCLLMTVLLPGCQWTSAQSTLLSKDKQPKLSWWRKQAINLSTSMNTSWRLPSPFGAVLNFKGSLVSVLST